MVDNIIEIRLAGTDLSPGSVRTRELAEVLTSIEDMIASIIIEDQEQLKKEDIIVGLASISEGSIRLKFSSPTPALIMPAFSMVAISVNHNEYSNLPANSIDSLQVITSFARRYNSSVEFISLEDHEKLMATITPETIIERIPPISGETTIYGMVMRVGGATPKVMLRTIEGITVYCEISREMAISLGERLYQTIGLRGIAKWNSKDWYLEEFKAEAITNYESRSINTVIEELSNIAGEYFADVDDVEGYISNLRGNE